MKNNIVLSGNNIVKTFGFGTNAVTAVNHVDFSFREKEIISIVGESGSGKTTLANIMLGLLKNKKGTINFMGEPRNLKGHSRRKAYWKKVQAIFQDPFSSFNQFSRVEKILIDCLKLRGLKLTPAHTIDKLKEACNFVNLKFEEMQNKYPFELSGGQRQRLMIARIAMLKPKILIADEPTSMIDACSRATILEMLLKLRDENNMTIVFITHDLGLAYYVSDTIYIMEKGNIVEKGPAQEIILHPKCEYTKRLLADVPKLHNEIVS
ncbi:MAG: dipeptide/oligopeptide/nickel ABC transporter ATP-binding protein [Clostridiales bacterium]